jgi:hypothetical protein
LVLSKEKPIPYQPPLPPNEAPSGIDAAAGVTPVGLRPPFVTPAAAHSHPDCRAIPILIVALHRIDQEQRRSSAPGDLQVQHRKTKLVEQLTLVTLQTARSWIDLAENRHDRILEL